jgi:sterol desaturase/sphingolipid hydroxylase (fatty acid hydroxylase superfamily)
MDIARELLTDLITGLIAPFAKVAASGSHRLFWPYLIAAAVIAYVIYRRSKAAREQEATRGFAAFLFPRAIWRHRSAMTDIGVVLVASIIMAVAFTPILPKPSAVRDWLLVHLAPEAWAVAASASTVQLVVFTVVLLVVGDFARFFIHYLMHRVPALWELHKVHHAAEVLTPFTAYRFHPIETALSVLTVVGFAGAANAAFVVLWGSGLELVTLFHANVGLIVFNLMGGVLRHSHVWFSFGPRIERYLVSPAMHQIHHSCEARHLDKNLGYHLSIWDRMHDPSVDRRGQSPRALRGTAGGSGNEIRSARRTLTRPRGRAQRTPRSGRKRLSSFAAIL